MLTKNDIQILRTELKKDFITKKEFKKENNKIYILISKSFEELMELLNPALKKIDDIATDIKGINDILDNHEHRLDKIEDKVLSTTANP